MNKPKTANAMFALIIAIMLVMTFAGLAAAGPESAANMDWPHLVRPERQWASGRDRADRPQHSGLHAALRWGAGIAGGLVFFSDANGVLDFGVMEYGDYQVQVDNGQPFIITVSESSSASALEMPVAATNMPTF